ncbi:LysR family transcriptional regulator [Massilia atriviolacea]|uniref:LysR family transcriptional regulator n=1 Tax=Massilia atriviolacea TaxID=2495579 RepID=A0A430HG42_9BURK|nr:LysR family transcriptional regulator [Massilia atriviolacea]RSZ56467.1 LysR family transcriptional regulator [Massilia atriviolacea]
MDTLRLMHLFTRAIDLGSLSAVAREAGTTQPTVSKAINALEAHLGVRLLERSTTGLLATAEGVRFHERARRLLDEYEDALAEVRGHARQATGMLRVNAPVALGQFHLNALAQDFLALHPQIEIELILNDRFVDLVGDGVDVAVRLGGPLPPDAVARTLAASPRWLVAAPSYLAAHARLKKPDDLARHDFLRFAWLADGDDITLQRGEELVRVTTRGRYRVNNALAIRDSLLAGAGIGMCPHWLVHDMLRSGRLARVLPAWSGTPQQLALVYPSRRYQPARARLFMDFLAARIGALPGWTATPA